MFYSLIGRLLSVFSDTNAVGGPANGHGHGGLGGLARSF